MYLEKRRRLYYAVHDIPEPLREILGRRKFVASLGTSNLETAKIEGAKREAEWRHMIKEVRARWKAAGGDMPNSDGLATYRVQLSLESEPLPAYAPPPEPIKPARFDDWLDDWAATQSGKAPKSIHMARTTITRFADALPLGEIGRGRVQTWVDSQVKAGASAATIKRSLSELRGYWAYLQAREIVSAELMPFERLHLPAIAAEERHAFPPSAITALVNRADEEKDRLLADAIRIGAFTGARIEEICTLRTEHIRGDTLVIVGTKTDAAKRTVPVHPHLVPTLKRLAKDAGTDGYLLQGLTANKFGDRSAMLSKRFARLKDKLEYGGGFVFHSIRKTFASALWSAGVERELISQLLGHATGHITTDVYAKDPAHSAKLKAIKRIVYPAYAPI